MGREICITFGRNENIKQLLIYYQSKPSCALKLLTTYYFTSKIRITVVTIIVILFAFKTVYFKHSVKFNSNQNYSKKTLTKILKLAVGYRKFENECCKTLMLYIYIYTSRGTRLRWGSSRV